MDKWKVKPNVSVGKIIFGMDRSDLRALFPEKYTEFKKSRFSKNTTDDYGRFHVFYSPNDKVTAVEFFEGIELTLNGKTIYPIRTAEIGKRIPGIEKNGSFYTHIGKSIGIEASGEEAESILIGEKGYYE